MVYHNSDDSGLEADALVTWSWDLARGLHPWRHAIGALGALGVYHDKEHDEADVGMTGGFFYSFRF